MRILKVRFLNLNSLVGEWEVDFNDPIYRADGIFAICGPTGAGKTTILDAVCLGLYGRTPRLAKISKSENELMSRQCKECFSEVWFETKHGKFVSKFRQRRAREKAQKDFQDPKRELFEAETGKLIESSISGVNEKIYALTDMDFDRFTKTMLLAQGGFAAFLEASPSDRSPLLEQITGTKIYSLISVKVFERNKFEKEALGLLNEKAANIKSLDKEEELSVRDNLQKAEPSALLLLKELDRVKLCIQWHNNMVALRTEIETASQDLEACVLSLEDFASESKILLNAKRARKLEGVYQALLEKRQQLKGDMEQLQKDESLSPAVKREFQELSDELDKKTQALTETKLRYKSEAELLKKVRTIDILLNEKKREFESAKNTVLKIRVDYNNKEKRKHTLDNELVKSDNRASELKTYFNTFTQDEALSSEYTGIKEQAFSYISLLKETEAKKKELAVQKKREKAALAELEEKAKSASAAKDKHLESARLLEEADKSLKALLNGRLLREYRAEYDSILKERAYVQKILSLETERGKLIDNEPCPLCGALDHPFVRGQTPSIDETDARLKNLSSVIEQAEKLEAEHLLLDKALSNLSKKLTETESDSNLASNKHENVQKDLVRLDEEFQLVTKKVDFQKEKLKTKLNLYGVEFGKDEELETVLLKLEERIEKRRLLSIEKIELEKRKEALTAELKALTENIAALEASISEKTLETSAIKDQLDKLIGERQKLYGFKNPDEQEKILDNELNQAEQSLEKIRSKRDTAKQRVDETEARIAAQKEKIQKLTSSIESDETEFVSRLTEEDFENESEFSRCRLPEKEFVLLEEKAEKLTKRHAELSALKLDREERLRVETEKKLTELTIVDLEKERDKLSNEYKNLSEEIGAWRQKLADHEAAEEKLINVRDKIQAQKLECERWEFLCSLIGSADGKRYRNFAQGLTFEIMVKHANRELKKMTDRYVLVRNKDEPLELKVVDSWQAQEVRSVKNLSGGERFVVSLALALGLSQMSGKNVKVDTLFLDEGFGALDEEALDTALETLAGLNRDGKLIGVISHVPRLKERIFAQIQVLPLTGGRSMLSGPGCRAL